MAAKFWTVALVVLFATYIQAGGYATFASTYNAHSINHAVAYPAGSKVTVPAVAAPPAVISSPVPASPIPAGIATSSATNAPSSKPVIFGTPVAGDAGATQGSLAAVGQISFASAPFSFVAPPKTGYSATPVAFAAYPYNPTYAANTAFAPSYGAVPAYGAAHVTASSFAVPPHALASLPAVYPVAPAYAPPTGYAPGSAVFAAGSPIYGSVSPASFKVPASTAPYAFW